MGQNTHPGAGLPVLQREEPEAANAPVADDQGHAAPGFGAGHGFDAQVANRVLVRHCAGPRLEVALGVDF